MNDGTTATALDAVETTSGSAAPSRPIWPLAAPWVILAVWLAVDLGVVIYWACNQWGFLGDLLLIIVLAFHLLGLLAWLTAYAILAAARWYVRLAYFVGGLAAATGITECVYHLLREPKFAAAAAAFVVGWSVPLVWLRRRGWQISAASDSVPPQWSWQFSIGDIIVAMTQVGAFLALTLTATSQFNRDELVVNILLLLGLPTVLIIALSWQRFWLAVAASLILCVIATALPMWLLATSFTLWDMGLLLAIIAGNAACLLAAAGCLRSAGYRLRRG